MKLNVTRLSPQKIPAANSRAVSAQNSEPIIPWRVGACEKASCM